MKPSEKINTEDGDLLRYGVQLLFGPLVGLLMLIVAPVPLTWAETNKATEARVRETIAFMASRGSRVAGYPGSEEAANFVENAFREIGLGNIKREEYPVVVPMDRGATLTIVKEGTAFALQCLWPNLVKTSTLPAEGVRGPLMYGRSGTFSELRGWEIKGSIVLMDFNSWNRWLNVASLGARAVIFIEPEDASYSQADQKHMVVPLSVERFWIRRSDADQVLSRLEEGPFEVELKARMDWVQRPAWNILGTMPGADPARSEEVIVVQAYYDGMSVVPALTPGAEQASSIAGLLELARYLKSHPPARTIVFLATSAHFLNGRGMVDFLDRHARQEDYYAKRMEEPIPMKLFISLDLSSHSDQIGIWNSTTAEQYRRFFAPFGRRFTAYAESLGERPDALINGITPVQGMAWSTFVPGGIRTDSQVAMDAGWPTLAFVTVNDARFTVDTPLDRVERIRMDDLTRQIRFLNRMLSMAFSDPDFFSGLEDFGPVLKDRLRSLNGHVRTFPHKSELPDRPVKGAVMALRRGGKSYKGIRGVQYALTDQRGDFYVPGLPLGTVLVEAYVLDPESGEITYAPDLGDRAQKFYTPMKNIQFTTNNQTIVVFPCRATDFYDLVDPRYLKKLSELTVLSPTGVAPRQVGYSVGIGSFEPVGVVFVPLGEPIRLLMSAGLLGYRMLLVNSPGTEDLAMARGKGFRLETHGALANTSFLAARDMWRLNEARIQVLKERGIYNERVAQLHDRTLALLRRAEEAQAARRWDDFVAYTRAALGIESRAYPDVLSTQNDVIKGIVFFLALVIPAAFFGERLLFAAPDIRWQIGGFGLVLLVIWLLISQLHPAFKMAHPLVILLAFAIMAMAFFVLFLILSRFNRYMMEYKSRQAMGTYNTDISRVSASYAAFMLGISNMRRRKLRTTLTLTTLILLTFTVLSFTAYRSSLRFMAFETRREGTYEGALIRNQRWEALQPSTWDYAQSDFEQDAVVSPRNWYILINQQEKNFITVKYSGRSVKALGVLGLTPQEPEITPLKDALIAGTWFEQDRERTCVLSTEMAERLGIGPADVGRAYVHLFGERFTVRGLMDAEKMEAIRDLDGEPLTPVDFQLSATQALTLEGPVERLEMEDAVEHRSFVHLDASNTVIVPYGTLKEVGGSLRSIAVRFHEGVDVRRRIEDFLMRVASTLFGGIRDEKTGRTRVYAYTSMGLTSVEGLIALLVPMMIAALIVLNTMLGAVYERTREIGIYSSVGLAPVHIAFLFVAEACVYAVIGITLGYMLGQGASKILIWTHWVRGINLNYSSMSAVVSAALVMGVVLLSTLYPARIAARTAVSDVTRRWKLPPSKQDAWVFEFPFTVNRAEVLSLCGFLFNYFEAYSQEGLGMFYAEKTRIVQMETPEGQEYAVQLLLWLAPFDMGVSQYVQFGMEPTGTPGIYAIQVFIHRISGQDTTWRRVNQRFMNRLRKEFLIWQTLKRDVRNRNRDVAERVIVREKELPGAEATGGAGQKEIVPTNG